MATAFSNTLQPSNLSNTDVRAWTQFIHNALVTTAGWTNTGDTGQVDLTAVTVPGGVSTKLGYKIYAMADALQATSPVFLRIDYGSGSASANTPAIWVTLGTGSNGSGTITGIVFNGGAVGTATFGSGTNGTGLTLNSYASGDTNRFHCGLFIGTTTTRIFTFSIERSKDSAGADTGTALLLYGINISVGSAINFSRYIIMAGGSQPADEAGVNCILSSQSPSAFNSNVGIGLVVPIAGYAQQPGTGMVIVKSGDFTVEATPTVSVYGATRTYQLLNALGANTAHNGGAFTNIRVGIRYD